MTVVSNQLVLSSEELQAIRQPRTDLLTEISTGDDQWEMVEGPFSSYCRTLTAVPATAEPDLNGIEQQIHEDATTEKYAVSERIEFKLDIPYWWPFVRPLMKRALKDPDRSQKKRWWWSEEIVTRNTARMFGTLATFGLISGYLGVLIGQTLTFAAEDFGADENTQSQVLAAVRIGVLLSTLALWRGHKVGRRPMTIWFAYISIIFTAVGAFAPGIWELAGAQMIARGFATGLLSLIALSTTEEVPSGSRAISISFMAMATAVGSALVLVVLPLADLETWSWRLTYLIPLIFLPLVRKAARQLPETKRFTAAARDNAPASVNMRRFVMVAFAAFAINVFISPASQLRNDFLNDDLGYSATQVSLFQAVIFAPAAIGIVVSGLIADRRGRRRIAAATLTVGAIMTAVSYQLTGPILWLSASVGAVAFTAYFPALRVYNTELFPTRARAKVTGWVDLIAVTGSAIGLVTVGWLSTRWGGLPPAIGILAIAPLSVVAVILLVFPETAKQELETFNPSDPKLGATPTATSGPAVPDTVTQKAID